MVNSSVLSREYLLTVLMEEAAEVIQAAAKCQRFGYDWNEPGYGINSEYLAKEVGDLLAVINALKLPNHIIAESQKTKIKRVLHAQKERLP